MVLYVIGLGLADEKDITVKGLEAVKSSIRIYLDAYTSILGIDTTKLEEFYGKPVILADRTLVESGADEILEGAETANVSFCVVGDPYSATTHMDLVARAHERGIAVKSIHNASIMNAIGCCGLQLYNYGQTITIPFFTETWKPDSFYDKIAANKKQGVHTMCLLDIKVKEQSVENLCRGRLIFEPPRYMTVNQATAQLLEIEEMRKEGVCGPSCPAVGVARVGHDSQQIVYGTLEELLTTDFGGPLHTMVIPADVHFMEQEMLNSFAKEGSAAIRHLSA